MDINALKNDVQKMSLLRSEVKGSCADLNDVGRNVHELVSTKLVKMKEELVRQFEQYFVSNDFEVTKTEGDYKALFNELVILLREQNNYYLEDYEVYYSLEIPSKQISFTIVIKASSEDSDKLYYKKNLSTLFDHGLNDTNARIDKIMDTNDLNDILKDIKENIDWYNKTIETFDNVKFVFSLYKHNEEFDNFQGLFESL